MFPFGHGFGFAGYQGRPGNNHRCNTAAGDAHEFGADPRFAYNGGFGQHPLDGPPNAGFGRRHARDGPIFFDEEEEAMYYGHQFRRYTDAQQAEERFDDRRDRRGGDHPSNPQRPEGQRPVDSTDRDPNARASASSGTEYAGCTQEQIDVLQKNSLELHEGFRAFPAPTHISQAISGFQAPHSVQPTAAAAAALECIKALVTRDNLSRDIVFKCFNDFDKALFGGVLRNRVLLKWKHPPTPDVQYSDMLARSQLYPHQERVIIVLNAGKLSGSSKELWGAFLHELVHAYLEILTGEGLNDHCQARPTRHLRVYWNMLATVDHVLGGVMQLNLFDQEQINQLRRSRSCASCSCSSRWRLRAHSFGAHDLGNDFGAEAGAGGGFSGGHGFLHDYYERAFQQEHASGHDGFNEADTDDQPGEGFPGAGFQGAGFGGGFFDFGQGGPRGAGFGGEFWGGEGGARKGGARAAPNAGADQERAPDDIDPYEALGIARKATAAEIKKAYRELSLANHPDKVKAEDREAASERMQKINLAKEILSDPEKRSRFDRTGTWKPPVGMAE
ncbi:hypothetical protein H2201_005377 [Coniosporium apollinis]|uniref:J domain-containing protein n=2 Tax=Coniosporium TaxID=2810619 RepID=A0ABQ9NRX8_9PEZI|nr:hypothetical protein H2199_004388 [Cladosporium sp. JES 115]KAJ9663895.1 hypothetical protein H2201_005377 [Coniosporium apollinis]